MQYVPYFDIFAILCTKSVVGYSAELATGCPPRVEAWPAGAGGEAPAEDCWLRERPANCGRRRSSFFFDARCFPLFSLRRSTFFF